MADNTKNYQGALLYGKQEDGTWTEITTDVDGYLVALDSITHYIHSGDYFSTGYPNSSVANGSSIDLMLQTSTKDVHITIQISSGGDSTFFVYENTDFSAEGTTITPSNHNRTSDKVPSLVSTYGPTLNSTGTLIWQQYIVGGTGGMSPGGHSNGGSEVAVLAPNTNYLFRLTNQAGTAQPLQIIIGFHEV